MPNEYDYRIVFMQRDMGEVLASQNTMLAQLKSSQQSDDDHIKKAYNVQLNQLDRWLGTQHNIETLFVDYSKTISDPTSTAGALGKFFGNELDVSAMSSAVEPALYREKS